MNINPCAVCKTKVSPEWTCRGGHWLCIECTKIPVAVFYQLSNGVGTSFVGGPINGEKMVVPYDFLFTTYRVPIQDTSQGSTYHYADYKFNWNLGFFVFI